MLLLDTHALIWLAAGVLPAGPTALIRRSVADGVFVSTASGWEIGLLHRKAVRRGRPSLFVPNPERWFREALLEGTIREAALTSSVAIASSLLPEPFHDDPGDWFIVATAREIGATLMTRDRAILDYAALGHVRAVAC